MSLVKTKIIAQSLQTIITYVHKLSLINRDKRDTIDNTPFKLQIIEWSIFFKKLEGDVVLEKVWDECDVKNTGYKEASDKIVIIENIEDMLNDTVVGLIWKNTICLLETLQKVNDQCNERSLNAIDIPMIQLVEVENIWLMTEWKMLHNKANKMRCY